MLDALFFFYEFARCFCLHLVIISLPLLSEKVWCIFCFWFFLDAFSFSPLWHFYTWGNYVSQLPAPHYSSCCSWLCMPYVSSYFSSSTPPRIKRRTVPCRASMSLTVAKAITDWMYYHVYLAYRRLMKHCYWHSGKNVAFMAKFSFVFFGSFVVL